MKGRGFTKASTSAAAATSATGSAGKRRLDTRSRSSTPATSWALANTNITYWSPTVRDIRRTTLTPASSSAGSGPQYM